MSASLAFETFSPLELPTPIQVPSPALPSHTSESLDIHSYPPTELLKLLADFLTHTTTTNDRLSSSGTSPLLTSSQDPLGSVNPSPIWRTLTTGSQNAVSKPASALTFHGKDVPNISVEAYLLRIHKYCPTTNQVFLSLLVYFDRMSKLFKDAGVRPFVINSFNVHRLIIAGYTVASKLSNDAYYKNSRYSKVGGIPLSELNQLETQFLLLNDFQLFISSTDLQHSAEKLRERADRYTAPGPISQLSSLQGLAPQPAADAYSKPRSAIWLTINSVSPLGSNGGTNAPPWLPLAEPTFKNQDLPEDTDALAKAIPSPSFPRSSFAVFKKFLKRRQHVRSLSDPNTNPVNFEIKKRMKSRRKAQHVHSTSESSSAFDTEGFLSSFPSDGGSEHVS